MNEDSAQRPIVTFAVFAFNQEGFIRDAIEGALAQTYSPLEIILSDDCSSDRTFEIMRDMAAAYKGPHRVIARQNPINLMTAQHVQSVANVMSGELMVIAAGDDISLPERVERLVDLWEKTGRQAVALHSQANLIAEDGTELNRVALPRVQSGVRVDMDWYLREELNPLLSPAAAYARCLFTDFPPIIGGSLIEDGPLVIRGFLKGEFLCVDEPLLRQRQVNESSGTGYNCENLGRWNRFVRSKIISNFNKLQDIPYGNVTKAQMDLIAKRTRSDIRGLSRCVFSDTIAKSFLGRIWIAVVLISNYPSTYRLRGRVGFALKFSRLLR